MLHSMSNMLRLRHIFEHLLLVLRKNPCVPLHNTQIHGFYPPKSHLSDSTELIKGYIHEQSLTLFP